MQHIRRRAFLKTAAAGLACAPAILKASAPRSTDIQIQSVGIEFKEYQYRVPIKFGGVVSSHVVLLNVNCAVRSQGGKTSQGFGSMPLANTWSFPSRLLPFSATQNAMNTLAGRISKLTGDFKEYGHPIELNGSLEPQYLKAAEAVTEEQKLAEPIPKLCTLVTASAFDAAVHDAYGKPHGLNCYHTYGPEFMNRDLSHYLGEDYKGEYPEKYVLRNPSPGCRCTTWVSADRSPGGLGYQAACERRPAGDASRVDQLQPADAFQNQIGRRRISNGIPSAYSASTGWLRRPSKSAG